MSCRMSAVRAVNRLTTEDPELADRFNRVLGEVVEAIEGARLLYAFIGGIASGGLGRPRSTHDIDLFVRPEDAELTLRALAARGFRTERTDPSWLYKAWKENVLVDVIFKSKGDIYLDSEMATRRITAEFHGKQLKLIPPEDLLIVKAVAHSELTPGHWHDAIALLTHASLDWDYLLRRARRAPRRLLSLFLYAQSNDIWVPNFVIHELYRGVFGDTQAGVSHRIGTQRIAPASEAPVPVHRRSSGSAHDSYRAAHLREALAEDPRCNELDIQIESSGNRLVLRGEVPLAERREIVERIARERFPDAQIVNQVRVLSFPEPFGSEDMR